MHHLKRFIVIILNSLSIIKLSIYQIIFERTKLHNLKEITIIPLGSNCQLAHNLQYFNLLKTNYGMEWLITNSVSCITKLIENDFNQFFSKNNIIIKNNKSIYDKFYDALSLHDGNFIIKDNDIDMAFHQKYERRLNRIKKALHHDNKIVFIRQLPHKIILNHQIIDETRNCIDTLKRYYPYTNFDFFLIYTNSIVKTQSINDFHAIRYKKILDLKSPEINIKIYQKVSKWYHLNHGWKGSKIGWLKILNTIDKHIAQT